MLDSALPTREGSMTSMIGVPYRIRTGVAAVRGHSGSVSSVRKRPNMYSKMLKYLEIMSAAV